MQALTSCARVLPGRSDSVLVWMAVRDGLTFIVLPARSWTSQSSNCQSHTEYIQARQHASLPPVQLLAALLGRLLTLSR